MKASVRTIKHAIISAAGLGSRLGMDLPKCLLPFGQHKLIYYQLQLLANIGNVTIVVGYKEREVMDYARKIRSDLHFVRNLNYRQTSTAQSIYLACQDLNEPFITLNSDLLIQPQSFAKFIQHCETNNTPIIGYTKHQTSDPVFIQLDQKSKKVIAFQRTPATSYEWCGIAYLTKNCIMNTNCYLYHQLENLLPLTAYHLDCYEIDTPEDLNKLYASDKAWMKTLLTMENEQITVEA